MLPDLRTISNESRLVSLHLGDVAMLQCLVVGLPAPSILWYRGDRILSLSKSSSSSSYFVHSDSRILEIQGLKSTDFGQYKCKAQNAMEEQMGIVAQISQHYNQSMYHIREFLSFMQWLSGGCITIDQLISH